MNVPAYTSKFDKVTRTQYMGIAGVALAPERLCGPLPAGVTQESYRIRPWTATRAVRDGERIDLGGRTLEVLLTPGHTPDSLCVFDRQHRLLFTGDTFYLGPIYLYVAETDVSAYEKSLARLAALVPQLDLLLPAHNVPVADPRISQPPTAPCSHRIAVQPVMA